MATYVIEQSDLCIRCGRLQVGDRVISVNQQYNLTLQEVNSLVSLACDPAIYSSCRIVLQTEFDVADTIVPTSGVFNVKLAKAGPGLGITITGTHFFYSFHLFTIAIVK